MHAVQNYLGATTANGVEINTSHNLVQFGGSLHSYLTDIDKQNSTRKYINNPNK